ncbi:hypothetical protein [Streptomyces sp. MST-110588]|uniref:hypothetical protein n=1 Tax=Streptomyces sp. MST-110588 TaxID=2833628 RepID=UPI001F5D877F|nr:hypothetical protein [Streptomyces sp. MST-110588]
MLAGGLTAGCGTASGGSAGSPGIQQTLDARAVAVRDRDARAFLDTVDPDATAYRDRQRRMFANLAEVPLAAWRYELLRTEAFGLPAAAGGGRRVAAEVRLRYRLAGYDSVPVTSVEYLTLVDRGGRWRIASDTDGAPDGKRSARQLWDQGPVELVRGRHSLVLGVGGDRKRLRDLADRTDRAVPDVRKGWPGKWAGRVVVQAPQSLEQMAQLLGAGDASGYRGIAAVTTGEAGAGARGPADRVIVNPEAYEELSDLGRQIVLTHETAHVATRAVTTPATPLWLSEGFADWIAYRESRRPAASAAPELTRAVVGGRPPHGLPVDKDFGFSRGAEQLAQAYEGGWLACRMIAEKWGEGRLASFYRAVGRGAFGTAADGPATGGGKNGEGAGRPARLDRTMRSQLGVDLREFTRLWRGYLTDELA